MDVLTNDAMRLFRSERDVARHLRVVMRNAPGAKTERSRIQIARLPLKPRPVNRPPVKTRRRSRLKPSSPQPQLLKRFAQQNRRRFSRTSRRILLLPTMNQPIKKSPSSNDDRIRRNAPPIAQQHTADAVLSSQFPVLSAINYIVIPTLSLPKGKDLLLLSAEC